MKKGYCVSKQENVSMDDYFKEDGYCVIYRIRCFHAVLFQGGWTLFTTQKICTFRIFHIL